MKIRLLIFLVLTSYGMAQQPSVTPRPLPPKPWLKRAPIPSQWIISFALDSGPDKAKPKSTPAESYAVQALAVSKAADVLVEVSTRYNGAVVRRWKAGGLFLTQVGSSAEWISSHGGPTNSFNETDYSQADFAGFDWISEKNFVGFKDVGKLEYLVFRDRVITLEPSEIEGMQRAHSQFMADWLAKQELLKAKAKSSDPKRAPDPIEAPPKAFNLDDYKVIAEATIDSSTGLPVTLKYQTSSGNLTRSYQYLPAPPTPLTLPAPAQDFVRQEKNHLERLSRPGAIP